MIKIRYLINLAIILSVVLFQLSSAVTVFADDGTPPAETPAATPTDDPAVTEEPAATPEATPTEELTPTETVSEPTEEPAPEETATPTPEETPAPEETVTPDPEETATPVPEETVTPDPEETVTPDPEATATPSPEEAAADEPECVPPSDEEAAAAEDTAAPSDSPEGAAAEEGGEEALPVCGEPEDDVTVPVSDPMWCPEGQVPGDPGCTPSFPTISELIAFLQANPTVYYGNGAIYFQAGTYTGPESMVVISYSLLPQMGSLSLMGGWDLDGSDGYSGNTGDTVFTVPVQVVWASDVTISDVTVTLPAGSSNDGIFVNAGGDVTLENVSASGGSSGAVVVAGGDVTVTGDPGSPGDTSEFNNNTNTGLLIYSSGTVTLADVVASNNRNGIFIDNQSGTGDVTLSNIFADSNGWTGLDARSAGSISLDGVTANGGVVGANLQATDGSGNIFVSDSTFNGNSSVGLRAVTGEGDITLTNVQTDSGGAPGSFGAWLKSTGGGTISVTGSVFVNAETGLFIVATGDVVLTNVTADGNSASGAKIESGWVFGCFGPDGISVTVDGGSYQNNGGYGFIVYPGPNGTATLAGTIALLGNTEGEYLIDLTKSCNPSPDKPSKPYQVVEISGKGDDPVQPDCETYAGVIMVLPDQTRVKVSCPVESEVTVATVAEEDLPGPPPNSVELIAGLVVVSGDSNLLPEGGSIKMCFAVPAGMENKHFGILYWDPIANGGLGGWIELPMAQFGGQVFPLHPDTPEDGMLILEGVHRSGNCVCVKVNFTGTFILVAR